MSKRALRLAVAVVLILVVGYFATLKKSQQVTEPEPEPAQMQSARPQVVPTFEPQQGSSAAPAETVKTNDLSKNSERELKLRFAEQLSELAKALPTRDQMKKKTFEEVHDTPQEVLDAGARLGNLKKIWLATPLLKPQAQAFYKACALSVNTVTAIRSLCLVNARALTQELGLSPLDEAAIPQAIKSIANQIPR